MPLKNILVLCIFLALSYLFFGLATDNGFWHSDDFVMLEKNLRTTENSLAVFDSTPPFRFQPLATLIYYLLFKNFFFDARGYFIFNIILHGFNSFLVYLLVHTLLKDRMVAILSGFLFVFTVGNYGKSVMIVSGFEDLLITTLTILTMIFYFKNELDAEGKILSPWFILAFILFLASMFTQGTSFAILGAFLAFDYFFRIERGRPVASKNFLILLVIAIASLIVKTRVFDYTPTFYSENPGPVRFILYAAKNVLNYLVRMIFPIHTSHLVTEAGPAVRFIYRFATQIRILIALTVVSYSFFGFIFGNRAIRFFIAWTYIMVLPFAFFQFPFDWLNIRHLYLVSVGFVMILSSGAIYCSRLISHQRWRRFVPLLVPVIFILSARFVVTQLDQSYEYKAASSITVEYRKEIARKFPNVIIEGDDLRFVE